MRMIKTEIRSEKKKEEKAKTGKERERQRRKRKEKKGGKWGKVRQLRGAVNGVWTDCL